MIRRQEHRDVRDQTIGALKSRKGKLNGEHSEAVKIEINLVDALSKKDKSLEKARATQRPLATTVQKYEKFLDNPDAKDALVEEAEQIEADADKASVKLENLNESLVRLNKELGIESSIGGLSLAEWGKIISGEIFSEVDADVETIEKRQTLQKDIKKVKSEIIDFDDALEEARKKVVEFEKNLEEAQENIDSVLEKLATAEKKTQVLLDDRKEAKSRLDVAENDRKTLEDNLNALNKELLAEKERLGNIVNRFEERISKLNQHLIPLAENKSARKKFKEAAKLWGAFGRIVSKVIGVPSQDAMALAPEHGRYALADGVSNSTKPEAFVRALVRLWTKEPFEDWESAKDWHKEAENAWENENKAELKELRENQNGPYGYSAGAAFIGAEVFAVEGSHNKIVRIVSMGDSCAFVVDGRLGYKDSFPAKDSNSFGSEVDGGLRTGGGLHEEYTEVELELKPGQKVLLMSDALSKWTFEEIELGNNPFPALVKAVESGRISKFIADLRDKNELDRDDSSAIMFEIPTP